MNKLFKIHADINFSAESIDREERGLPLSGPLFIETEDGYFPSEGWPDSPAVVLSWWLGSARTVMDGKSATSHFMEGPFIVVFDSLNSSEMRVTLKSRTNGRACHIDMPKQEYLRELIRASSFLRSRFSQSGLSGCKSQQSLEKGLESLEIEFSPIGDDALGGQASLESRDDQR